MYEIIEDVLRKKKSCRIPGALLHSCHTRAAYSGMSKSVSNAAFTRAPVCSLYVGLTTLANRRRSDGARLAGRHGIFY